MRQWLALVLRRWADWLDPPSDLSPLERRALTLVRAADALDAGGEFKRRQVYAQLLKDYPAARRRDVGLAIEVAMQRL